MKQTKIMQAVEEIRLEKQGEAILKKLVDGLNPNESKVDKRIIYELTGLWDEEFYLDETDQEDV